MDNNKAKQLLAKIAEAKKAEFDPVTEMLHKTLPAGVGKGTELLNQRAKNDAMNDILKLTAYTGLGMGGLRLLGEAFKPPIKKENKVKRVVEMPIPYQAKAAVDSVVPNVDSTDDLVTSKWGLNHYVPGVILGPAVAGIGSWLAIDKMLKRNRQKDVEENTDFARQEYETSLKNMYKKSADELLSKEAAEGLDNIFAQLEKVAEPESSVIDNIPLVGALNQALNKLGPNAYGFAKGLALTNAAVGLPLGYALVNNQVRKNSKRKLVDDAMKERQRLRALQSPTELYAVPTPIE